VVESGLQPYDYLALVPVIEGAGGVITDWQGRALHMGSDGRVVAAATPELQAQALAALA
jgi:myo-inositol-1(or 4)-monophosphatase